MRKTIKETIKWHPVEIVGYPRSLTIVLMQTNDGVMMGVWDEKKKKWFSRTSVGTLGLNSDCHVIYWTNIPNGVGIQELYGNIL